MGWQDDEIVKGGWQNDPIVEPKKEKPPERSIGDSLKRAAGLTARYAVEGSAALPGLVLDPLVLGGGMAYKALGGGAPSLGSLITGKDDGYKPTTYTAALSRTLTNLGLPEPEGAGEKVSAEISKALTGGGLVAQAAKKATAAVPGLLKYASPGAAPQVTQAPPAMVRQIAASPTAEMVTQGIGSGAGEAVRQEGGPEWAALGASVLAPTTAQGGVNVVKAGARGARELVRPFTESGARQIAADTAGRIAQDKGRSLHNIDEYLRQQQEGIVGVPGSKPTAGAVSGDYGLVGGEQLISRGDANPRFAGRNADNNAARIADLERLNATKQQIAAFEKKRDEITAPLRERAFANEVGPVDYGQVQDAINRLRKSPEGGKQETARALDVLTDWVTTRIQEGRTSARDGYALHQDINDLIKGRLSDDKGAIVLSKGMATEVKHILAAEINKVAPGFKGYLAHYSRLSRPIERLEIITDKLGGEGLTKTTTSMPSVSNNEAYYTLSQDKVKKAVDNINAETRPAAAQSDVLNRVLGDLNAQTFAQRGGKLPGSDTYQNMASANFVNRVLGDSLGQSGLGRTVTSALGKITPGGLERRVNDMLIEAYLDPKKMKALLEMARTSRASPSLTGLLSSGGGTSLSGLLGATAY